MQQKEQKELIQCFVRWTLPCGTGVEPRPYIFGLLTNGSDVVIICLGIKSIGKVIFIERTVRKYNRLFGYDYSKNGTYFVTICTENKKNVLSEIKGNGINSPVKLVLSSIGTEVEKSLLHISQSFPGVHIANYVIMPNHVHIIVVIHSEDKPIELKTVIGRFKSFTTKQYGDKLWQRSFYDHIVRDEEDYAQIDYYINRNPQKWAEDRFFG